MFSYAMDVKKYSMNKYIKEIRKYYFDHYAKNSQFTKKEIKNHFIPIMRCYMKVLLCNGIER